MHPQRLCYETWGIKLVNHRIAALVLTLAMVQCFGFLIKTKCVNNPKHVRDLRDLYK